MSRPVQYCDGLPRHPSRGCKECKRIQMAVYRGKSMEEARGMAGPEQPICRSCRVRFLVKPPEARDFNPILMSRKEVSWLENAARLFDELSGSDLWTAQEFIAWLTPDLSGRYASKIPDYSGILRNGMAPSSPDPLPMVPSKLRKMVS